MQNNIIEMKMLRVSVQGPTLLILAWFKMLIHSSQRINEHCKRKQGESKHICVPLSFKLCPYHCSSSAVVCGLFVIFVDVGREKSPTLSDMIFACTGAEETFHRDDELPLWHLATCRTSLHTSAWRHVMIVCCGMWSLLFLYSFIWATWSCELKAPPSFWKH